MTTPRTPLSANEIAGVLNELPGWTEENGGLKREFTFKDFRAAFAFMTQVAMWAEKLNHHPDWSNAWNKVTIHLCTHDAGRVITAKDVELATKINKIPLS